jgi:hypothetical protein
MENNKPYLKEKIGIRDIIQMIANLCIIYIAFAVFQNSSKTEQILEAISSISK